MARVEARSVADLERELREARGRLADGERTLQAAREKLQVFATRYQTSVGERFDLLTRLQSAGTHEPVVAPERPSMPRSPRAGRPPGHLEFERLYRELALRVHPDLANDAGERAIRTRLMAELNVARDTFDFERARKLGDAWDLRPEDVEGDSSLSQFDRLLLGIERVEARLTAVAADAVRLRESGLYRLMEVVSAQQRSGIDVLAETAADLDVQIAEARSRIAIGHDHPAPAVRPGPRSLGAGQHVTEVGPGSRLQVAPLAVGVLLAGFIAVGAALLAAASPDPATVVTAPASSALTSGTAAQATAAPLSYRVIERQQSTSGRTTATVRVVVEGSPSAAEKMSTLAAAARREIRSQEAVVVYAYRSAHEIGGPYTVGRAYLSVDGRGWDGDGLTEDGRDSGSVVGSIVVTLGATPETQVFSAPR